MSAHNTVDTTFYMACLNLTARRCLVVGAGSVALEKIEGLLACGASITVVAPEAITEIRVLAESGKVEWCARPYTSADLAGRFLVVAATSITDLNRRIYSDGEQRSMLVNVVDVPALCNFILPAVVREGPLAIAVSTAGASPALAKRIKREIADVIGAHHARLALLLNEVRGWARSSLPDYAARREFFDGIVNGYPDPVRLLRDGDEPAVRALIARARATADPERAASG
ncbi:MAG: bifunctional precorrin-2 dehydrogenase/sirohydrochlorin ferrochelatase [Actinomycetota bacterium]